ncbi:carbohydrate ABC transporter permease [Paenibacillus thalictri]|uniref:Carbohydrate ABC transporter permease n=2 Tax=Paenibacillus thalictri TaxID=2527873 RepID=A0A4Q9DQ80_9BACL|nr:carbohydrate ABC transporter permease [Paenibacillus thalictri]
MSSFSTKQEVLTRGFFLIPHEWTLGAYRYLMNNDNFVESLFNAVYITAIGTFINIVLTSLMAYGMSKSWLKGRKTLNFLVLVTMIFSGGIIPTFLIMKGLHLLDSYWAIWLGGAIAPFHLIVMRSFFQNIPQELDEAGHIDGCGEFRLLVRIILPLAMPAVATFTLFYMVGHWNTYFTAILYINDTHRWPLQVILRQMLITNTDSSFESSVIDYQFGPPVKMAAIVVTALPLLVVYPFLQKYFNKGMLLGSVKG